MKEQFDKDLAKKIRDSFETYEEPYDPKAWERLSKAYFKPRKNAWAVLWPFLTTGLAASLFLAVFLWPEPVEDGSTPATISDASEPYSTHPEEKDSSMTHDSPSPEVEGFTADEIPKTPSQIEGRGDAEQSVARVKEIDPVPASEGIAPSIKENLPEQQIHPKDLDLAPYLSENKDLPLPLGTIKDTVNQEKRRTTVMEQAEALEMLENWKNLAEDKDRQEKPKEPLPFKLGVLVAPQSSSNPVAGMNLGAGLMSEFSLSKKIKLDVGVTYARQSMSPENQQAMPQTMDMALARTNSNFLTSSYQLDFASLDIPINLKYQVMENKNSGFYLITGLSSMVYLSQQATESFQTNSFFTTEADGLLSFSPSVQQFSTVITPEGGGNNVDLGRMVNLSVGYEYNLSDGMYISFEPFYKLPIGSLTFANQQFSIGGLNLRMNFKMGK
jgi:hypothetical protein